jgi:hypothetical protein
MVILDDSQLEEACYLFHHHLTLAGFDATNPESRFCFEHSDVATNPTL